MQNKHVRHGRCFFQIAVPPDSSPAARNCRLTLMSQAVVDEIMMSNALLRTHARRRGHYNLRGDDDDDDDLFIPIISNQKVTGTLRGPTTWCNGTDSGEKTFQKQSSSLGDDTG